MVTVEDVTAAELDDWFDAVEAPPEFGVRGGRYRFPPPPGIDPAPRGWMRMSNLAAAFSDQRALQLWLERATLLGLRYADELLDELCAVPDAQITDDYLHALADRARERAGANAASIRGTARHTMLQGYLETGAVRGHGLMREQLGALLEVLDGCGLDLLPEFSERVVWHPAAGGTMGRLDARVRCRVTGQEGVIDLKTKVKKFWTYQEVAAQEAGYDSAPWMWCGPEDHRGTWQPAPANTLVGTSRECRGKRVALIAHLPQAANPDLPPAQIIEVDLEYGNQVLACCAMNVRLRSIGKATSAARRISGPRLPVIV